VLQDSSAKARQLRFKELLRKTAVRQALCIDSSYNRDRREIVGGKPIRFQCDPMDADLVLVIDVRVRAAGLISGRAGQLLRARIPFRGRDAARAKAGRRRDGLRRSQLTWYGTFANQVLD